MSGNLLQNHSFEAATLDPWQFAGDVTRESDTDAFEREHVAELDLPTPLAGETAVLSQAVTVATSATHLHLSYAIKAADTVESGTGQVIVKIRWQAGAENGFAIISEETVEVINEGSLTTADWDTHVIVSGPKPTNAKQARLRFILEGVTGNLNGVRIDEVVLTTD